MKRILVTGNFKGSVTILYGEPGVAERSAPPLLCVDFREAALNDVGKSKMLNLVPVRYGPVLWEKEPGQVETVAWKDQWQTDKLIFTEADVELDFENDFWWPFNNPINRLRCEKAWGNLTKADRAECVAALGGYLRHLGRCQWKNKMNPQTWFRDKCWKTNWDNLNE